MRCRQNVFAVRDDSGIDCRVSIKCWHLIVEPHATMKFLNRFQILGLVRSHDHGIRVLLDTIVPVTTLYALATGAICPAGRLSADAPEGVFVSIMASTSLGAPLIFTDFKIVPVEASKITKETVIS